MRKIVSGMTKAIKKFNMIENGNKVAVGLSGGKDSLALLSALSAKMRRGTLNSTAKSLGCNKVALAHHCDDLMETFFLSLFFEGRLSTFSPVTYLSNVDITAIRPLIYVGEEEIINATKDFPILKNVCPANHKTKREEMKNLLKKLDQEFPNAKKQIKNAILNPERNNLINY